jgi:hypothetical protein
MFSRSIVPACILAALALAPAFGAHRDSRLQDDPEKKAAIQAAVAAGQPNLVTGPQSGCPDPGAPAGSRDLDSRLSEPYAWQHLCVKEIPLSAAAAEEVRKMSAQQLDNHSDYDQRASIVRIYRHGGDYYGISPQFPARLEDIRNLAKSFRVPAELLDSLGVMSFLGGEEAPGTLRSLTIDGHFVKESAVAREIRDRLRGKLTLVYFFTGEIPLYPGGGLLHSYTIYFTGEELIYVKRIGWES